MPEIYNCDRVGSPGEPEENGEPGQADVSIIEALNNGIRGASLNPRDAPRLADFFGVSVVQCRRWFARDGQQYRRMIVLPPNNSSPFGLRPFAMFDEDDPQGFGNANRRNGAGRLQSMRLRVIFAACFALDGLGFKRDPIYTGATRSVVFDVTGLNEAIHRVNSVYTGNHNEYLKRAWIRFRILPREPPSTGWRVEVLYNVKQPTDDSNAECEDILPLPDEELALYDVPTITESSDE